MKMEAEMEWCSHEAKVPLEPPEAGTLRKDPCSETLGAAKPCRHFDFGFLNSKTVREYISVVLSHRVSGNLWQVVGNQYTPRSYVHWQKKCTSYKVGIVFYSEDLLRTSAEELRASQIALRHCSKEVREEPGYIGRFDQKKSWLQMITDNHKNRHLKLTTLVIFCVWKDARVWAHGNYSFDILAT